MLPIMRAVFPGSPIYASFCRLFKLINNKKQYEWLIQNVATNCRNSAVIDALIAAKSPIHALAITHTRHGRFCLTAIYKLYACKARKDKFRISISNLKPSHDRHEKPTNSKLIDQTIWTLLITSPNQQHLKQLQSRDQGQTTLAKRATTRHIQTSCWGIPR